MYTILKVHLSSFQKILNFENYQQNIHNWPLQPFSRYHDLASHITHVMCVNFIRDWRDIQLRQIFEQLFHGRFI